ncbi:MAG: hypothetical protein ACYC26_11210 [Phycisphaerales bacterium]
MTRYGLALVIVRSMAVAIWAYVLANINMVIYASVNIKIFKGELFPFLLYMFSPIFIAAIGLALWLTSRRIARAISDGDVPGTGVELSADEAMLMRVAFSGIGMVLLVLAMGRLPHVVAVILAERKTHRIVGETPGWSNLAATMVMLSAAVILLVGYRKIAAWLIRLRKFD